MIYTNANQRAQDMRNINRKDPEYKLAEVTSVVSGHPVIRFRGESTPSAKKYKKLSNYSPAVGDAVLLVRAGATYVVLGKIE